ncbi:MAG: hypothetical protein GY696_32120 [Gammaproteobacteria bacterium]|nr:hypothetical protein [Gammaproteobacteria bacterium]
MTTEVLNIMPPAAAMVTADSSPRGVKRMVENENNSAVTSDLDYETPPKRRMSGNFGDTNDNENGDSCEKSAKQQQQKRRRRRRRQKRSGQHKGYYEMTEVERRKCEERTHNRLERTKEKMLAKGHMLAPYNSTQFLINDANDDTVRLLDEALHDNGGGGGTASPGGASSISCGERYSRSRQSSFSVEDEEEYFYSSPDDEGEFLTKEFSKDYEQSSVDRLEGMPKDRLIMEYLGMEKQVEALEKRLEEIQDREAVKALTGEVDYEFSRGEIPMEPETAQKIKVFQAELRRLAKDNKALQLENARLKRKQRSVRTSAAAGSSGSFWPANGSTSSSDSEEEQQLNNGGETNDQQDLFAAIKTAVSATAAGGSHSGKNFETDGGKTEDTGYESTQSKEQTPERDFVRR